MALAETAQLIVELKLRDQLTGPLRRVPGAVAGVERGFGRLSGAAGRFGGALRTAGGNIRSFVTGSAGLLGLTIGIAGAARFIGDSIGKAQEFGRASEDLAALLGEPVMQVSKLVDVLDKFGVNGDAQLKVIGRLNKNAQQFAGNAEDAAKFQTEWG